jgi:hypothetical protein
VRLTGALVLDAEGGHDNLEDGEGGLTECEGQVRHAMRRDRVGWRQGLGIWVTLDVLATLGGTDAQDVPAFRRGNAAVGAPYRHALPINPLCARTLCSDYPVRHLMFE